MAVKESIDYGVGSDNVFRDLGLPDADRLLEKAKRDFRNARGSRHWTMTKFATVPSRKE